MFLTNCSSTYFVKRHFSEEELIRLGVMRSSTRFFGSVDLEGIGALLINQLNACKYLDKKFEIPRFVFDNCLDYTAYKTYNLGERDNPFSLRKYIIDNITDSILIEKLIIRLEVEENFIPCGTCCSYNIPYKQNSFKELLEMRLEEITGR